MGRVADLTSFGDVSGMNVAIRAVVRGNDFIFK
jgi:6-phosphofructokinase